jgi:hypothetical protein
MNAAVPCVGHFDQARPELALKRISELFHWITPPVMGGTIAAESFYA